jgi:hypothetical protein
MTMETVHRGERGYLIGAAAIVVLVAVLALVFGVVRPPAVAGLTDVERAALPGGVAWTQFDERSGCTQLVVARPDDGSKAIACDTQLDQVIGWTTDGILTVTWIDEGQRIETRDPSTGEVLATMNVTVVKDRPESDSIEGGYVVSRSEGTLVVARPGGTAVWETPADARYEIGTLAVSPDGAWVAITDSAERLLVVRTDGSETPAVWATGVREWAWRPVVWEGTELLSG